MDIKRWPVLTLFLFLSLTAPGVGSDFGSLFEEARSCEERADYGCAYRAYGKIVELFPEWELGWAGLLEQGIRAGIDHSRMLDNLKRCFNAITPHNPRIFWAAAKIYEEERDWEKAFRYYSRLLDTPLATKGVLYRFATVATRIKRDREAYDVLKRLAKEKKAGVSVYLLLAEVSEREGDLLLAEEALLKVISLVPQNPYNIKRLVDFYKRHNRLSDARRWERKLKKMSPIRKLRPLPPSKR